MSEELEEVSSEQIEIQTPDDAEVDKQIQGQSPEDAAAMLFKLYWPIFKNVVERLSNKSLKRLIKAMIAVPLEDAYPNLKNEIEKNAYAISERLLQAKVLMVIHMMYQNPEQVKPFEDLEASIQN